MIGKLKKTVYKDAISYKFDSRRITVGESKNDDGLRFEFRTIDEDYTPHAICKCVHGKLAITSIKLTREASVLVMTSIAEMLGLDLYTKIENNKITEL